MNKIDINFLEKGIGISKVAYGIHVIMHKIIMD